MTTTVTGLLEQHAAGHDPGLRDARTGTAAPLSELLDQSQVLAGHLFDRGVRPGDLVGLVLQNGTGFLRALLGAMYAGAVPIPLALPSALGGPEAYGRHLRRIAADARMTHLIAGTELSRIHQRMSGLLAEAGLTVLPEPELIGDGTRLSATAGPDDLAFVQYTSGSTSAPKGVALTHRNITAGMAAIATASQATTADTLGCWLPLFHDMGLFSVLSGIISCAEVVIWPPGSFVRDPVAWLGAFTAAGCTLCPAPNFFYDYLIGVADEVAAAGIDLSRWRLAYNGAEPVHARTVQEFAARFARCGFRAQTMFPVYGMAEATLAVTFTEVGAGPRITWVDRDILAARGRASLVRPGSAGARAIVGVGRAVPGVRVRIGDAGGRPAAERDVGEIQISGTPVTAGYYGRPAGDSFTPDGWLRTGDQGFLDRGELHVVGRSKDIIIVRGVNYHAEDAEALVRGLPGIHRNRCVAVPAAAGREETLALVAETRLEDPAQRHELELTIQAELRAGLGLTTAEVHLVPPYRLPQTSSGKIQRRLVQASLARDQGDRGAPVPVLAERTA